MRLLIFILTLGITAAHADPTISFIKRQNMQMRDIAGSSNNLVIGPALVMDPVQTNEVIVEITITGSGASAFRDAATWVRFGPGQKLARLMLRESGSPDVDAGSFTFSIKSGDGFTLGDFSTLVASMDLRTPEEIEAAAPNPPTITLLTPADSATDDSEWALPFTSSYTSSGEHRIESITYQVFDSGSSLVSEVAADMSAVGYAGSTTLGTAGTYTTRAALHYDDENGAPKVVYSDSHSITVTDPSITVSITDPSDADTLTIDVADTVSVTATPASGTITQVQLFEDGVLVDTDSASPWVLDYTPSVLGSHTLTVTATRSLGGTESDSIDIVCIPVANNPPTVELALGSGSDLEKDVIAVILEATPLDTDGTISGVEFFRDATSLGTDSGAPYTITDTTELDPGEYTYSAVATDDDTDTATAIIRVIIIEDQTPYQLTGPGDATAETDQSITLTAAEQNGTGTYLWEQVSGPGTVTFGSPTAIETTASTDASGDHVVRITATVSGVAYIRTATLTIVDPPYVFTGPANLTLEVDESGTMTATEANGPADSYAWSTTSAPAGGTITFGDDDAISTTVSADVAGSYTVTVTATKDAVPYARTATLTITATDTEPDPEDPPTPDEVNSITLPVLVFDQDDQTDGFASQTVSFKTNSDYVQASGTVLEFTTFNLAHGNTFSVSINGQSPILVRDTTVTVDENLLNNHGDADGYLGDFPIKRLEMAVQDGILNAGANTIRFAFHAPWSPGFSTTGVTYDDAHFQTAGYRVLYFNLREPDGDRLLDSSDYSVTDYSAFTAPAGASSATGQTIWNDDTLLTSNPDNQQPKRTSCADCHGTGNILAYLRMENDVIVARSRFHGLTETQGEHVAAYIRSLSPTQTSTNAFPWSLPYQPGPNLATLGNSHWAAGEMKSHTIVPDLRIPDVLDTAAEHRTEIYGASIDNADLHYSTSQDAEWSTRIHWQTLSYPQWLPDIHPKEFLGSKATWNNSNYKRYLDQLKANPTSRAYWDQVRAEGYTFIKSDPMDAFSDSAEYFTGAESLYPYSVKKIAAVIALDLEIQHDLSGTDRHASEAWDNSREITLSSFWFDASPLQSRVKTSANSTVWDYAMGNRSVASKRYFDVNWYALQMWTEPYFYGDNRMIDSGRSYFYAAVADWRDRINGIGEDESVYAFVCQLNNVLMRYCQRSNDVNDRFGGKYLPHFNPQVLSDGRAWGDPASTSLKQQMLLAAIENFLDFVDQIPVATWQTSTVVSGTTSGTTHNAARDDHDQLHIWYELLWNLKNRCGVSTSNSTYVRLLTKAQAIWPSQASWP